MENGKAFTEETCFAGIAAIFEGRYWQKDEGKSTLSFSYSFFRSRILIWNLPMEVQANMEFVNEAKSATERRDHSMLVAILSSFTGGFLDAFTYVGHGAVFANSMTGNIVLMGISSAAGKWQQAFVHLPPIIAFLAGIYIVYRVKISYQRKSFRRFAVTVVIMEILIMVLISFLPRSFPDNIIVPVIALAASVQYESFYSVKSYTYSSVTTTANLKKFVEAVYDYKLSGSTDSKKRIQLFGLICLFFSAGAMAGAISTNYFHNLALWIPVFTISIFLIITSDKIFYHHT